MMAIHACELLAFPRKARQRNGQGDKEAAIKAAKFLAFVQVGDLANFA